MLLEVNIKFVVTSCRERLQKMLPKLGKLLKDSKVLLSNGACYIVGD
jgi:hypothetical protein